MKQIIITMLLAFTTTGVAAQGNITGRVIDEQSQPIPFVNVVLLNRADSAFIMGTVTKDDGTFTIETDRNDELLKVSSVGYQTQYIQARQGNVGDIQMQPDNQTLGEVVVKGYRPIIKQEHEKTIFNVKHMPNVEALKVMDVMKFAPGVVVTANGGIYVAGKDAAVFVNDRRLSGDELTTYLNSLKASDIERIEVMQNHAGAYDASIQGGVVNIVTKRTMMGFIGSADLYAATPRSGYYELTPPQTFSSVLTNGMFTEPIPIHRVEASNITRLQMIICIMARDTTARVISSAIQRNTPIVWEPCIISHHATLWDLR